MEWWLLIGEKHKTEKLEIEKENLQIKDLIKKNTKNNIKLKLQNKTTKNNQDKNILNIRLQFL